MSTVATTAAILPSFAFFCLALFATNLYPSNTVYYILSFLSARLAGSSAGSLQCEKKQRQQQASKKYWRTPSGRKEIIDKYPLL